jgi:hypothetical protein
MRAVLILHRFITFAHEARGTVPMLGIAPSDLVYFALSPETVPCRSNLRFRALLLNGDPYNIYDTPIDIHAYSVVNTYVMIHPWDHLPEGF